MKKDWYNIALKHLDKENYAQAIVAIDKYVELNPENKYGKLLKAIIFGDLSNYDLALQLLNEVYPNLEDGKHYAKIYFRELGDTYKEIGNSKEAIKWYDKMIESSPDETTGYIFKGSFLASLGKYELAKSTFLIRVRF